MRYLIFDTETTDLVKPSAVPLAMQPHVIEFFGLVWDDQFPDTDVAHHYMIKPPISIPAKITEITGINDHMVKDAAAFAEVSDPIMHLIQSVDRPVAHNLSFDKRVLNIEYERLGKVIDWPKGICTIESTIWMRGHRLKLSVLYEMLFGEGFSGAHRAENDVRALLRVFKELKKRGDI